MDQLVQSTGLGLGLRGMESSEGGLENSRDMPKRLEHKPLRLVRDARFGGCLLSAARALGLDAGAARPP